MRLRLRMLRRGASITLRAHQIFKVTLEMSHNPDVRIHLRYGMGDRGVVCGGKWVDGLRNTPLSWDFLCGFLAFAFFGDKVSGAG